MRIEGKYLIPEMKDCWVCSGNDNPGHIWGQRPCPRCSGTGRTKGGKGKGECRECHGFKTRPDPDVWVTCPNCKGAWRDFEPETVTDDIGGTVYDVVFADVRVYRLDRDITFIESYIGAGCWSSHDYGIAWGSTDEQVLQKISDNPHKWTQACKVVQETPEGWVLPDHIGVFVNRQGYAVQAVWAK